MITNLTNKDQQSNWRFCNKCGVMFFDGLPGKGICPAGGSHEPAGFTYVMEHELDIPNTQRDWRFCNKCGVTFFDGFPGKGVCPGGGGHEAAGFTYVMEHDVPESPTAQRDWRFCTKCGGIFFDGFPGKGVCPNGGGHEAAGFNYVMQHDSPESSTAQQPWRFCSKCGGMFFDGFPGKGICPSGGGHEGAGSFTYLMQHDVELPTVQRNWRFCTKCGGMFFNGFPGKGVCPGGAGHQAAGFTYVIQHDVPETPSAQSAWRFCSKCSGIFFDGFPGKGACPAGSSHEAAGFTYVMLHDLPPQVFGAIGDKWRELGGMTSFLGAPTSDELDFDEGGKVRLFNGGAIYFWSDTGAMVLPNNKIALRYSGFKCFGTSDGPGDDEPYLVFGIIAPVSEPPSQRTRIYENVAAGNSVTDSLELVRGAPAGIAIDVTLSEHDLGSPDKYRKVVDRAISDARPRIAEALTLIPAVGPVLSVGSRIAMELLHDDIVDAINGALGTGEDRLGQDLIQLTPKRLVVLATRAPLEELDGVPFRLQTKLFQEHGSSYKACFDITPA